MYVHRTHVKHTPVFYTIVQEINKNKLRSMPLRIKPFFCNSLNNGSNSYL